MRRDIRKELQENYVEYLEEVKVSERNKDIVYRYLNGCTQKELAKDYNISQSAIQSVISSYKQAYRKLLKLKAENYDMATPELVSYIEDKLTPKKAKEVVRILEQNGVLTLDKLMEIKKPLLLGEMNSINIGKITVRRLFDSVGIDTWKMKRLQ